jgi:O-antigen biosynthesis protein
MLERENRSLSAVIVEAGNPEPERDAGSRVVMDLKDGLARLGYSVSIVREDLEGAIETALATPPRMAVLSRPGTFLRTHTRFDRERTKIVYLAHDLHHLRMEGAIEFSALHTRRAARAMRMLEMRCLGEADVTLFPTNEEATHAFSLSPKSNPQTINYYWFSDAEALPKISKSSKIVFVGSADHLPNRDGLMWFLEEVWTSLIRAVPEVELHLVGDWSRIPEKFDSESVTRHGHLSEESLSALLVSARVGIAPLRFGAGMKRKTLHYLSHGLPVVSTSWGVQGLSLPDQRAGLFVSEDPKEWISALASFLENDNLVQEMAQNATTFVKDHFTEDIYLERLRAALSTAGLVVPQGDS